MTNALRLSRSASISGRLERWRWTSNWLALAGLWLLFAAILLLRNPDALLHAEFWAEDGWAWFPGAYNDGAASLIIPVAGYLQTISRIAGLIVQAFPMAWAPTLFAVMALAIQALPPAFLVSARMQDAWPSPPMRLMFALLWLGLPNSAEVYLNITNTQWHLATLTFLILLSRPPSSRAGFAFDAIILLLSGLSGPFCLLLLPIAAWQAVRQRGGEWRSGLLMATAIVQGCVLLQTVGGRSPAPLGAKFILFTRIVAQQVILGPLVGQAHMPRLQSLELWQTGILPILSLAAAAVLTVFAIWRGPTLLRMACVLGTLMLTAALIRPQISGSGDQWPYMQVPGVGQRYYFLPMLAWIGVILWLASLRPLATRLVGAILLSAVLFGTFSDWSMPVRQPSHYSGRVEAFLKLPKGEAMAFPINPFMDALPMVLIRK